MALWRTRSTRPHPPLPKNLPLTLILKYDFSKISASSHADLSPFLLTLSELSTEEAIFKVNRSQASKNSYDGANEQAYPWFCWSDSRKSKETRAGRRIFVPASMNFKRRKKSSCSWGWGCWSAPAWLGCSRCRLVLRFHLLLFFESPWFSVNNLFLRKRVEQKPPLKGRVKLPSYGWGELRPSDIKIPSFSHLPPWVETNNRLVFCGMILLRNDNRKPILGENDFSSQYSKSCKGNGKSRNIQAEGTWFPNEACAPIFTNPGGRPAAVALVSALQAFSMLSSIPTNPYDANMGSPTLNLHVFSYYIADGDDIVLQSACVTVFDESVISKEVGFQDGFEKSFSEFLLSYVLLLPCSCHTAAFVDKQPSCFVAPCASPLPIRNSERLQVWISMIYESSKCIGDTGKLVLALSQLKGFHVKRISSSLAQQHALAYTANFADSSSLDDLALAYVKLVQHLAVYKGYKEAFAAFWIVEQKFLDISRSRVVRLKLQLLHDLAIHRGHVKLAQQVCDELGVLASPVSGVDMACPSQDHLAAAEVANSLFCMCYKFNLEVENATVLLLLAEIHKLSLGSCEAKRALNLLHGAFPMILGHGGLELRARAQILEAKCYLSDDNFSVSEEPDLVLDPLMQACEALEVLEYHELVVEAFYLLAIVYDKSGNAEEREKAASSFKEHMIVLQNPQEGFAVDAS